MEAKPQSYVAEGFDSAEKEHELAPFLFDEAKFFLYTRHLPLGDPISKLQNLHLSDFQRCPVELLTITTTEMP